LLEFRSTVILYVDHNHEDRGVKLLVGPETVLKVECQSRDCSGATVATYSIANGATVAAFALYYIIHVIILYQQVLGENYANNTKL
jgi:hypothetical protein